MTLRILTENYYNPFQFSGHTITASTYQAGNEPWRVGTGRRSSRNAWISPTTGEQSVRVTCDQVRAADVVALDRGHNVRTLKVQFTNSTAAGWTTHKSLTIPTATYQNVRMRDGARMPDGAYICRFATSTDMPAAINWRLACATTGGGAKVKVVGAYLGKSFAPSQEPLRPWSEGGVQMQRAEVASPELWTAASRVASRAVGSASVRLNEVEGDQARLFIKGRFWEGEVAWITPDEESAELSVLATAPSGTRSLPYPNDWPNRVLALDWVEHQPKPR